MKNFLYWVRSYEVEWPQPMLVGGNWEPDKYCYLQDANRGTRAQRPGRPGFSDKVDMQLHSVRIPVLQRKDPIGCKDNGAVPIWWHNWGWNLCTTVRLPCACRHTTLCLNHAINHNQPCAQAIIRCCTHGNGSCTTVCLTCLENPARSAELLQATQSSQDYISAVCGSWSSSQITGS